MKRTAVILGLILALSVTSYAQEFNYDDRTANWDSSSEQQLLWNRFLLKPQEKEMETFALQNKPSTDRVDPGMPVIVPSADDSTQFPIKVIPKNFPSNMPVAKLPDGSPFDEAVKPKVTVVPRNTLPHP